MAMCLPGTLGLLMIVFVGLSAFVSDATGPFAGTVCKLSRTTHDSILA